MEPMTNRDLSDCVQVGDRLREVTPGGAERLYEVMAVDIEPKYRHGYQGSFMAVREIGGMGARFNLRRDIVDREDWIEVVR